MDIRKGDYVKPSKVAKQCNWWPNVKHLTGEYLVIGIDGEYVFFKTPSHPCRRWYHTCLELASPNLENV